MKFSLPGREDGEKNGVATLECRIEVSKFVNLNFIVLRGLPLLLVFRQTLCPREVL